MVVWDGLERAKASRADDADNAVGVRGGGICGGFRDGIVPNDGARVLRRSDSHCSSHCPQLALFQSPPSPLVRPHWVRKAPEARAPKALDLQEQVLQEIGQLLLTQHLDSASASCTLVFRRWNPLESYYFVRLFRWVLCFVLSTSEFVWWNNQRTMWKRHNIGRPDIHW